MFEESKMNTFETTLENFYYRQRPQTMWFSLSGFRDFALFQNLAKFSFQTMDYSPWGSKNGICPKKIMKVEV